MQIPKRLLTEAQNTVRMFVVAFAAQVSLAPSSQQLNKHIVVAALIAAGRFVLVNEAATLKPEVAAAEAGGAVVATIDPALGKTLANLSVRFDALLRVLTSGPASAPEPSLAATAGVVAPIAQGSASTAPAATQSPEQVAQVQSQVNAGAFMDPPVASTSHP